jgi:hypothetical protein
MNNTTLTAQELTQLEELLMWVSEQEEIPAKTRRDFLAHIMKKGFVDEHSLKFIDQTLKYLDHRTTESREYFEKELAMWTSFVNAENNEETSLQVRDVKEAEKLINEVTDEFVTGYKEAEKEANDIEESDEKSHEISEIDKIKQSLN